MTLYGVMGLLLAGCAVLPAPDGMEARLIEQGADLRALDVEGGKGANGAVRRALLMAPEVRLAAAEVGASADQIRVQRAALFPSLGLGVGGGFGKAGDGAASLDLDMEQLLLDFGRTGREISVADLDMQISYLDFQARVDEAIIATLTAWEDEAIYRGTLALREEQLASMRALEARVAVREREGAASSADLLEARKRMLAAEFLVVDARLRHAEARDRLQRLSGLTRGAHLSRSGQCEGQIGDNEVLRIARLQEARAVLVAENAENARLPRLIASPLVRQPLENGGGISFGLNLGLRSDLLQGGALSARANAARNEREAAASNTAHVAREMQIRQGQLGREISAARAKDGMFAQQIELIDQTRTIYADQYFDLGKRDLSDLLDIEEEYYDRRAERLETRRDAAITALECTQLGGRLRDAHGLGSFTLHGYPLVDKAATS